YECSDCSGCPVKSDCTYGEGNRSIQFTPILEDWKQTMSERMSQGKGQKLSRGRGMAIESVFGLLKHNDGMRRLLMRGNKMVDVEVGLKSLAYNLRKMRTDILGGLTRHLMIAMSLQSEGQTLYAGRSIPYGVLESEILRMFGNDFLDSLSIIASILFKKLGKS